MCTVIRWTLAAFCGDVTPCDYFESLKLINKYRDKIMIWKITSRHDSTFLMRELIVNLYLASALLVFL